MAVCPLENSALSPIDHCLAAGFGARRRRLFGMRFEWSRVIFSLRRVSWLLVFVLMALAGLASGAEWGFEAGSVVLPLSEVSSTFVPVSFRQAYSEPPVVVVLSSSADGDPVAVRVRSVTATGFELVQVEPGGEDGPHGPVEVHYLAVEPGAHILSDGTQIEAGVLSTSAVQHGSGVTGGRSWDSITFGSGFASPPVLVVGLQTTANETAAIPGEASEPWLVVAVQGVTASGAEVALERSESAPGEVMGPETIGWVAIEAGVMTTLEANDGSPVGLESLLTATEIRGWDNGCREVDFTGTYGQAPLVVGHQQTRNGGDGGWLRRCAVDAAWVSLAADEDRFRDAERAHGDEVAGLVIVEKEFDAVVQPPPVASLATASARVAEDGGSVSVEVVLDYAASDPMEIAFTTADGTASAGADYTGMTGVLPFVTGQAAGTITVPILDDAVVEGSETFSLTLTGATGGFLGTSVAAEVLIADDDTAAEPGWRFETDSVVLAATDGSSTFVPLLFRQSYAVPPVVVVLSSSADGDPVAVRVRSVTTTGFELVQVEPGGEDGPHGPVEVHYLAVEPGAHILMDGTRIGAGFVMTTAVQHGTGVVGSRSWDSITFGTSFGSPPVLVAGLQTTANETAAIPGSASEPWLVVAVQGVTASGAEVALERSESAPGEVMGPETIGWVAIEAGVVTTLEANDGSTVGLESLLTATEIRGWDNGCRQVDFAGTYGQAPLVVGHQQTRNGGDGGWLRRCAVDAAGVSLAADEDRFRDAERAHGDEVAGLVIAEKEFDAVVQPPPVASLATASVRVAEGGGSVSVEVVLDHAASDPMEISFTTADGSAVAGADYTGMTGVLPFGTDQAAGTITVPILDDILVEGSETFVLTLTGATGGFLGSTMAAEVLIADDDTAAEPGWRFETDSVVLSATDGSSTFVPLLFRQSYAVPPVVVVLSSSTDGDPVAVRVRSVTATGFELVQVEPGGEDGPHGPVAVHYLAVEPGAHILTDGTRIEAGVLSTGAVQHGSGVTGGRSWDSITFGTGYASSPVLVAGLQTTANETAAIPGAASEPWLVVAVQGVTVSGAEVALERSESAPGEVAGPETIGWVAIETGVMTTLEANDGLPVGLESLLTATEIRGWDNGCRQVDFAGTYGQAPLVVGHQQTRNGGDGGWLRRCAVDAAGVSLAADEDRFRDTERAHADEAAGLVIVERGFDAVVAGTALVDPEVFFASVSTSIDETAGVVVLTVYLSAASASAVSVDYATAEGSATAGEDFIGIADTLIIPAGQLSRTIEVAIIDDLLVEGDEAFSVVLSNPQGAVLGAPATTTVTITDDDQPLPTIQFASAAESFGEAEGAVSLTVELSAVAADEVTVGWSAIDGTAVHGEDYTGVSGELTIAAGQLSGVIELTLLDDALPEDQETFSVVLDGPVGAELGLTDSMTITIEDDDAISSFFHVEPENAFVNEGEGPVELTVVLDPPAEAVVTVRVATIVGTAEPGADYVEHDQVLVFDIGETSHTVTIEIIDDTTYEAGEIFTVQLLSPTGSAGIGEPSVATVEIAANDDAPIVYFADGGLVQAEYGASESIGEISFPVRLTEASGVVAQVDFATFDDEAIAGEDYVETSLTLVFEPGQVEQLVTIPIIADDIPEEEEEFRFELSSPVGCSLDFLLPDHGSVNVYDNQEVAFVEAAVSQSEGAGSVELTIRANQFPQRNLHLEWRTSDGTASADLDYEGMTGNAEIEGGDEIEVTISIPIFDDNLSESDETFFVTLFHADRAAIVEPSTVTVTIIDDDEPAIMFDGSSFAADEDGGVAVITVVVNQVQDHDVSVDWAAADGTATFGDDYTTAAGTVTVPAFASSAEFQIDIVDDADSEADETIQLSLSGAVGIALGEPSAATLTILDDDRLPVVSFAGDAFMTFETADAVELTIVLNESGDAPVVVQVDTSDGTAVAGSDYIAVSETITIPVGGVTATVTVPLIADGLIEGDEIFTAALSVPQGAELGQPEITAVTIVDDATLPLVSLATDAIALNEHLGPVVIDVVLDRVPVHTVTVRATTADGEAVAGTDYLALDTILTFDPGVTNVPVIVEIIDDLIYEFEEGFSIALSEPSGVVLDTPSSASVTIEQSDWPPFVFLADGGSYTAAYTAFEQNGQIAIPVHLSDPSGVTAEVDYATSGGTATEGEDYEGVSGTKVFVEGQTEHLIVIAIQADAAADSGETFEIALSNAVECTLDGYLPYNGVVTIRDDAWVSFAQPEISTIEDAPTLTIAVTLSAALAQNAYVSYSTSNGSAIAGEDYTAVAGTLHFTPGAITRNITVPLIADIAAGGRRKLRRLPRPERTVGRAPRQPGHRGGDHSRRRHPGSYGLALELHGRRARWGGFGDGVSVL